MCLFLLEPAAQEDGEAFTIMYMKTAFKNFPQILIKMKGGKKAFDGERSMRFPNRF